MFSRDTLTLSSEISFIESYPVINVIKGEKKHQYVINLTIVEISALPRIIRIPVAPPLHLEGVPVHIVALADLEEGKVTPAKSSSWTGLKLVRYNTDNLGSNMTVCQHFPWGK